MTRPPLSLKNAPVLSRRLARANERGAALFVVVLLITMLLGIGTYAARSATLATTASGHERQMTQTHYMAEYAIILARAQLEVGSKPYMRQAKDAVESTKLKCRGQDLMLLPNCYRMPLVEVQAALGAQPLFPTNGLGKDIEGVFDIEIADVRPDDCGAGMARNASATAFSCVAATVTAYGQIRYKNTGGATLDKVASKTASVELSRAYLSHIPNSQ